MERKRKTTLLLDPEVWRRFQEDVFRSEGARATSAEVERLMRATDPAAFADTLATVFPRASGGFPSSEEVERGRPKLPRRADVLIREERDERDDRVLGLKRNLEAVARQRRH